MQCGHRLLHPLGIQGYFTICLRSQIYNRFLIVILRTGTVFFGIPAGKLIVADLKGIGGQLLLNIKDEAHRLHLTGCLCVLRCVGIKLDGVLVGFPHGVQMIDSTGFQVVQPREIVHVDHDFLAHLVDRRSRIGCKRPTLEGIALNGVIRRVNGCFLIILGPAILDVVILVAIVMVVTDGVAVGSPLCSQRMVFCSFNLTLCGNFLIAQIPASKSIAGLGGGRQCAVSGVVSDSLGLISFRQRAAVGIEGHGVGVAFPHSVQVNLFTLHGSQVLHTRLSGGVNNPSVFGGAPALEGEAGAGKGGGVFEGELLIVRTGGGALILVPVACQNAAIAVIDDGVGDGRPLSGQGDGPGDESVEIIFSACVTLIQEPTLEGVARLGSGGLGGLASVLDGLSLNLGAAVGIEGDGEGGRRKDGIQNQIG